MCSHNHRFKFYDAISAVQVLYYECLVKIIRAQPVRARMLISNVLYNCNASLGTEEVQEKATKV